MRHYFLHLVLAFVLVISSTSFAADDNLAKQSTINRILERGELRVGFDAGYMPFEMTDKKGNFVGFDIDLGKELAKAMGVKYTPVNIDFDGMIPALLTDKIDIIISAMTITQERNLRIGFSNPYIKIGQTVLLNSKHKDKITSWEQLNNEEFTIISRQGTTSEMAAKRLLPKAKHKTFEKEIEGALEVANNRGDAFVYDLPFNVVFVAEHGAENVIHLDKPFTFEPLGFGIKQGDPDFMNFLNNFLNQINEDGRYERIYNKWMRSTDWFDKN